MQRNNLMKNIPGNGYLTFICKIRTLSNYSGPLAMRGSAHHVNNL